MRVKLFTAGLTLAVGAVAVPVAQSGPAAADDSAPCPSCDVSVTPEEDGIDLSAVREEAGELNEGESEATRQHCDWTDDGEERDDGWYRWRVPLNDQDVWQRIRDTDPDAGTYWRLDCWHPDMGQDDQGRDRGDQQEIRLFENVNPENLARLAMDEYFQGLPAPRPRLNPEGTTMVGMQTWLWVENIPEGEITSDPVQVPGIVVQATARHDGVEWDMGDGSPRFTCEGAGTDGQNEEASCWHVYDTSSAGEPNAEFEGSARVVWLGTYTMTIDGQQFGGDSEMVIPREEPFQIAVGESQAVVTD